MMWLTSSGWRLWALVAVTALTVVATTALVVALHNGATARHALRQRTDAFAAAEAAAAQERTELNVKDDALTAEVAALKDQVRSLGGTPVVVTRTNTNTRVVPGPPAASPPAPNPSPTTTTTAPPPRTCRTIPVVGGCTP